MQHASELYAKKIQKIISINKYIYKLVKEQFSVDDLDYDDASQPDDNIFNKLPILPRDIYNKILNDEYVYEYEVKYMNSFTSEINPDNISDLVTVIYFYDAKV